MRRLDLRSGSALLRGVFNTADVGYFLVLIVGSLLLGIRRLDAERLGH